MGSKRQTDEFKESRRSKSPGQSALSTAPCWPLTQPIAADATSWIGGARSTKARA